RRNVSPLQLSDSIELKFWRILQRVLSRTAQDSMVRVPLVFRAGCCRRPEWPLWQKVTSLSLTRSTHRFIDEFQFAHINDKGHAFGDGLFLERDDHRRRVALLFFYMAT